jgi:hypothetical protein
MRRLDGGKRSDSGVPRQRGVTKPPLLRMRIAERTQQEGECLVWTGNINVHGYPRLNLDGKLFLVHRLVKTLADAKSNYGFHVHHVCRNKRCVRAEHLRVLDIVKHAHEHSKPQETCPRGHTMRDAYIRPDNRGRQCRECIRLRTERALQLRRARRRPPGV